MPSTFLERPGSAAKIRITPILQLTVPVTTSGAGVFYNIQDWSVDDEIETGDTTHIESELTFLGTVVAKEEIEVSGQVRWMIKSASYDATNNLFVTPLRLTPAMRVHIEFFPNGILSTPYILPRCLIKKRHWEGKAGGLQPVTLEGVTLGTWSSEPAG